MGLTDLTQSERPHLASVKKLLLIDVEMPGVTLYWSTRDFVYRYGSSAIHYDGYVLDVTGLREQIHFGGMSNPNVVLTLANEPFREYSHLSRLNDDIEFQRSIISFRECLLVADEETFDSLESGRTLKWRGCVERLHSIDSRAGTFKLDCCSRLYDRRNRIGLTRVNTTDYPSADKTAIGQWRNHPIGSIEYVPCKLVKTGATDLLFAAIGADPVSTLIVSGTSRVPWPATSIAFQIDSEKFTATSYNATTKTFFGVQRAAGGTTAAAHNKGATVWQVVTDFIYEASRYPVDAISQVDVDGLRQTLGTTCRVYTGRPGSRLTGYGSSAVVRFTVKPTVVKQINADVEVASEHGHTTSEGAHGHSFSGATVVTRTGVATLVSGRVESADYCRDGDENSGARLVSNSSYPYDAFLSVVLDNSTNLGAISAITVKVLYSVGASANSVTWIRYGQLYAAYWSGAVSLGKAWRTYAINPAAGWGGYLDFYCARRGANDYSGMYVYEVKVEITCSPTVSASPASGVVTSQSGSTVLSSSTVAEAVIGREVAVTMTSIRDDTANTGLYAGAITGASGALITRPDHVIKYFLCSMMGVPLDDIGSTFATTGALYESLGYRLAFLTHDIATDGHQLLQALASQCRSILYEWHGQFHLKMLPTYDPVSYDFRVDPEDVIEGPVHDYQSLADTANRIMVLFRKDYRTYKESGAEIQGPIKAEAADAGYIDYVERSWGAKDLDETVHLTAIRESAAAEDYVTWHRNRKLLPERTIKLVCRWRETLVSPGMVFRFDDPVEGDAAYLVTSYERDERGDRISIQGQLLPVWSADDVASLCEIDEDGLIVQTHLVATQNVCCDSWVDSVAALTSLAVDSVSVACAVDAPIQVEQTHQLWGAMILCSCYVEAALLGVAWETDSSNDLQPSDVVGVLGWWEDDPSSDLMPRSSLLGTERFWELDGEDDVMPSEYLPEGEYTYYVDADGAYYIDTAGNYYVQ